MRTAVEAKVDALGPRLGRRRVLRRRMRVELERVLVAALARLETPHVKVLQLISGDASKSAVASARDRIFGAGWSVELIAKELPKQAILARPLIAGLEAAGLVEELSPSTYGDLAGEPGYRITAVGRLALERLAGS